MSFTARFEGAPLAGPAHGDGLVRVTASQNAPSMVAGFAYCDATEPRMPAALAGAVLDEAITST